jgi:site-specific recombinase XerD
VEDAVATVLMVCYGPFPFPMILSFYERKDSPFVWVQYALHPGDPKRYEKTPIRKDETHKRQKKARYRAQLEEQLLAEAEAGEPGTRNENGWSWVLPWIGVRYQGRTAQVYRAQWRWLREYLEEHEIAAPLLLEREHCYRYVTWRTGAQKQKSGRSILGALRDSKPRSPKKNTAIGELKFLAQVMDEAKVRRLYRADNPARKLGLEKEKTIAKPEISNDELSSIFAALETRPAWMSRSFNLALRTGLRSAETRLVRSQVDWPNKLLRIENPKGGRAFSIPIYSSIEPLIRKWWEGGDEAFWEPPEGTLSGLSWTKFFREIGLGHLCFHCTRVTFISRGARAGIPEGMMMKLVNHASEEVHRIYQRLPPGDAARLVETIPIPDAPGAIVRNRNRK